MQQEQFSRQNANSKQGQHGQKDKVKNEIMNVFKKLNNEIELLNVKVQSVMEKHQGQFVHAYKNHVVEIKKQLEILKKKADEQERQLRKNDRAVFMEKQATIFRQQSLKLYQRLQQKTQQLQIYKMRTKDLEKTTQVMQKQIRQVLKNKKIQQTKISACQLQIKELQRQLDQKKQQIRQLNQIIFNSTLTPRKQQDKNIDAPTSFIKKIESINLKTKESTKLTSNSKLSSLQFRNRSISYVGINRDSQLKQWFLQCVKTIKKEIANRKYNNGPINLDNINSISEFKMVDKLRLLQKFIQNQKLLTWMYQKIFPTRINELKQYLSHRNIASSSQNQYPQGISEIQNNNLQNLGVATKIKEPEQKKSKFPQRIQISVPKSLITKERGSYVRNRLYIKTGKLSISDEPILPINI